MRYPCLLLYDKLFCPRSYIYQLPEYDLIRSVAVAVHQPYPFHRIGALECFIAAGLERQMEMSAHTARFGKTAAEIICNYARLN